MLSLTAVRVKCPKCKRAQTFGFHQDSIVCLVKASKYSPQFVVRGKQLFHRGGIFCDYKGPANLELTKLVPPHFCEICKVAFSGGKAFCPSCNEPVVHKTVDGPSGGALKEALRRAAMGQ